MESTGIGINAIASTEDSTTALIGYSGWSVPPRWVKYDAESGAVTTVFEVNPAADYSMVHAWRLDASRQHKPETTYGSPRPNLEPFLEPFIAESTPKSLPGSS